MRESDLHESERDWRRFAGRGVYPVAYAAWLVHPLRMLISPPRSIADRLGVKPADRVLEIGCGPGFFSAEVARRAPQGRLWLLDSQAGMIELARKRLLRAGVGNVELAVGVAEQLPFDDATFDVAFMVTVLGETGHPTAAMREIARVLKPGGRASITEAAGDPDRLKPEQLHALAWQAGLKPEREWLGLLTQTFNYVK